jgi:hypothetical protein
MPGAAMPSARDDQSVANAPGATVRADINSNLQALVTLSSGAAAPGTTWAYQLWADTTNGLLKQRNAANSGWLVRGTLAETFVLARSSNTIIGVGDFGRTFNCTSTFTPDAHRRGDAGRRLRRRLPQQRHRRHHHRPERRRDDRRRGDARPHGRRVRLGDVALRARRAAVRRRAIEWRYGRAWPATKVWKSAQTRMWIAGFAILVWLWLIMKLCCGARRTHGARALHARAGHGRRARLGFCRELQGEARRR